MPRLNRRRFLLGSAAGLATASAPATALAMDGELLRRDFAARQASEAVRLVRNKTAQRPYVAGYSLIVGLGQSNMQGDQGAWAGASPPMYGNTMLGEGTRPSVFQLSDPNVDLFLPVGGSNTITPLLSVNQNNTDGTPVTVNQGGFANVTGASFATSPKNVLTLNAATGTMYATTGGALASTAVGGPGQPALDLTLVFSAGMGVWFGNVSGSASANSVNNLSECRIASVTPTTMTLTSAQGFGFAGTSSTPINISVTNNFGAFGEDACVTQCNDYAALALADGKLPSAKGFGVLNTAIAGQPIAALEPGATPDQYNRAIDGVTRFVSAAAALGKAAYVVADVFEQGNGDIAGGTDTSQAAYTAGLYSIYSAHRAAYPGITGQTKPPLFLVSQTSGFDLSGSDYGNDAVSMAQLLFCTSGANPDAYCIGPTYYAPNQGVHETPNGQRWKGAMRAKIMYRILALNQGWLPLYPTLLTYAGNQVTINFNVPAGSLQFRPAYKYCTPTVFPDAGFKATDASGVNPVTAVQIVGGYTVVLTFGRDFVSPPQVQYADGATHGGIGNLFDTDTAVSSEIFSFVPFSGQPPSENIPAFTDTVLTGKTFPSPVGQPYALFNPCCVFNLPAMPG